MQTESALTPERLEFVLFCVDALAEALDRDPIEVYDLLTRDSDLLRAYLIPCYDPLHTQGKEYITEVLLEVMRKRGLPV